VHVRDKSLRGRINSDRHIQREETRREGEGEIEREDTTEIYHMALSVVEIKVSKIKVIHI